MMQFSLKKLTFHNISKDKYTGTYQVRKGMKKMECIKTGKDVYLSRKLKYENLDDIVYM